jgi:hypothetical protein
MKTLPILGVSLLFASLGFVVTAPVFAAEVAVSMSAMMHDGASYTAGDSVNTEGGVLKTPAEIDNLSVSAAVGTNNAMAGGFTDATSASSIAGAGIATGALTTDGVTLTSE